MSNERRIILHDHERGGGTLIAEVFNDESVTLRIINGELTDDASITVRSDQIAMLAEKVREAKL